MKLRKCVLLFFLLYVALVITAKPKTIRQQIEWLRNERKINFVYDSSLPLDKPYKGKSLQKMTVPQALQSLLVNSGIDFSIMGNYIMLKQKTEDKPSVHTQHHKEQHNTNRHYTLSGFAEDENGERLINATIRDVASGLATMTNSSGFFSITLPEGTHIIRCGYIGFDDKQEKVNLKSDIHLNFILNENANIKEIVITADLNSPLMTTQTGKHSFGKQDIKTEFALLSSPDVIKTLQRSSGVASGVELTSGLYVHGGNNDENLFLIDGSPLYQVNHALGLFSAFNSDVVKNIDFYKGGFPARYGGRLSSVVDVRTDDGDLNHYHGSYRLGLLDGSLQFEGPIRKGKTSFNFGLRRSWIDILSRPIFALYNKSSASDDKLNLCYFFHDLNAKITNIFDNRNRLSLSVYSGEDKLGTKDNSDDNYGTSYSDKDVTKNDFNWGNFNMALLFEHQFSPKLFANFNTVYTYNISKFKSQEDEQCKEGKNVVDQIHSEHEYKSSIRDYGYRISFDYRPSPHHHIRFGNDFTWHFFHPQTRYLMSSCDNSTSKDTTSLTSKNYYPARECSIYAEDEMIINGHWSINAGINASLFSIHGKTFTNINPRFALKYQPFTNLSFKASYTSMTQYVHKISNSFLELPTDYWVPTTEILHPMNSWQLTAGAYFQPHNNLLISLEGYYKHSNHLLQYASWSGLEPPAAKWDKTVMDGEGRFYGMELDASYKISNFQLRGSYTLSWNQRKYEDFYPNWYFDKFDNRHKIDLSARWQITHSISAFADWTFHSGNHITIPTQYVPMPNVPEGKPSENQTSDFIYEKPNNFKLPNYHRLDLGFDFHHITKHHHERIFNISFYNAYCHYNSMYAEVKQKQDGHFYIKNHAYIPVIPSFSYTIKF